jgi:dTDP-glucose pyrophosphorylase
MEKAVILARGLGTRMRRADEAAELDDRQQSIAQTGVKALIPVERPFLDYVLTAVAEAGYRRVCLVIGPEHDEIRSYYQQDAQPRRLSIEFAIQQEPKGTADAVAAAEAFAAADPFLTINSDNYYPVGALRALRELDGFGVALFNWENMLAQSNIEEDRLRRFSVGQVDGQGHLRRILEKPDEATWNALPRPLWISMNCWRFGPEIFEACRAIEPSPRGEFEIPDAVQHAIDVLGQPFRAILTRAPVLDLSSRKDVASIAEKLAGTEVSF